MLRTASSSGLVVLFALGCSSEPAGPRVGSGDLQPAVGTHGDGCATDPSTATGPCTCNGLVANRLGTNGDDDVALADGDVAVLGAGDDFGHVLGPAAPGQVTVCAGSGNDEVQVGLTGALFVDMEAGIDTVGVSGPSHIFGGPGDDYLAGSPSADRIFGGGGLDVIFGVNGGDLLNGGADADTLLGGNGDDKVDGGPGVDWLSGGGDDDKLLGRAGADFHSGGDGTDQAVGFKCAELDTSDGTVESGVPNCT